MMGMRVVVVATDANGDIDLADLQANGRRGDAATIRQQTHELIGQSADLSFDMFGQFLRPLGERSRRMHLPSR